MCEALRVSPAPENPKSSVLKEHSIKAPLGRVKPKDGLELMRMSTKNPVTSPAGGERWDLGRYKGGS
jgi:hypothetical protein